MLDDCVYDVGIRIIDAKRARIQPNWPSFKEDNVVGGLTAPSKLAGKRARSRHQLQKKGGK